VVAGSNPVVPTKQSSLCILQGLFLLHKFIYECLEGRLPITDNSEEMIIQICERIEKAIDVIDTILTTAKKKLRSLLRNLERK
jgi:hypothetical protein